ncbi:hypothetical protein ABPG72_017223 [Tetrahymena utriculariae]
MGVFIKRQLHILSNQSKSSSVETGNYCHSPKCKRLQKEHSILVKMNHPNIVKCEIQFYQNEERCCIRLEQADCDFLEYLTHFFQNRTKAFFRTHVSLLRNIASAIDYLHQKNYVHNDIKLENCLLFVQADKISLYQQSKNKTNTFDSKPQINTEDQMSRSTIQSETCNELVDKQSSGGDISSSCSLSDQSIHRKDSTSSDGSKKQQKKTSSKKGRLILKLADFEFTCMDEQCQTIDYLKSWKLRNRKYMSPEMLDICYLLETTSQTAHEIEKEGQNLNNNPLSFSSILNSNFKRACSLYCDEPQKSVTSVNNEEEISDSQMTISTDFTVGSNLTNNEQQITSQEKLQNIAKSINMKANDIFCFGILCFSSIFGVYPFQKEPSKQDPIFSLIVEDRLNEFWNLFESRIKDMLVKGLQLEQLNLLKDLLQKLLQYNPQNRPNSQQILLHPYFTDKFQ